MHGRDFGRRTVELAVPAVSTEAEQRRQTDHDEPRSGRLQLVGEGGGGGRDKAVCSANASPARQRLCRSVHAPLVVHRRTSQPVGTA
ncbi:hypothetical protein ACWDRB_55125 [Nonomuraea sp. NPDC003707]